LEKTVPTEDTLWELEDHTRVKHQILKHYIDAWFPILNSWKDRVIFVDGFCGPGEYSCGSPGSPVIALRSFRDHRAAKGMKGTFLFTDESKERIAHLKGLIESENWPDNITIMVENCQFEEKATKLLDAVESKKRAVLYPSLWFVDPFGWSGIPMRLLSRISRQPKSELFLNFMASFVNRFLFAESRRPDECYHDLFGGVDVRERLERDRSLDNVVDIYKEILLEKTQFKYAIDFAVGNVGKNWYHLIYATTSETGIEKMKDAMWKADPTGSYRFSARTQGGGQMVLLDEADLSPLRTDLLETFKDKEVKIEAIDRYVLLHTVFRKAHIRRKTLAPLEKEGAIEVIAQEGRRKGSYPPGTVIRFVGI
jgi:three-Cys-motif partner protein